MGEGREKWGEEKKEEGRLKVIEERVKREERTGERGDDEDTG